MISTFARSSVDVAATTDHASGVSIVFAWSLTTVARPRPCDVATIDKTRQEPMKEMQAEKRVIVFWVF